MARYIKYNSSYILRKKHQQTTKGTILYRDWVTTGSLNRFVPGKKPYYQDSNFVFTISNVSDYQKKHKYGSWVGTYSYDDVKDAKGDTNEVKVNTSSNDLRDYAYFGSCLELVRASIESIIREFPAQFNGTNSILQEVDGDEFKDVTGCYFISNPFNIDLNHKEVEITDDINPMRYMSYSYQNYQLDGNDITSYNIEVSDNYQEIMACPQNFSYGERVLFTITINNSIEIKGLWIENMVIYVSDNQNFVVKPKDEIIEEYFNNLKGFERQLLNRSTTPLYKNTFITPIEGQTGTKYVNRDYIWPSVGYQIDIESPSYTVFVNNLISIATYFDNIECDNLYRSMTHEAIKNYDWTYTREYSDGEEQDNIDGGTRVEQLLRLYGRSLDDLKREIDGIKFTNSVTYDGFNNQADALLSDKAELLGWEAYSTIPALKQNENDTAVVDVSNMKLTREFLEEQGLNWYSAYNTDNITPQKMDNEFMRRMILNSKRIFSTKGTVQSIDMVMGMFGFGSDKGDYVIEEEYGSVVPANTDIVHGIFYNINYNKQEPRLYDDEEDPYSGVPLKDVSIGTKAVTEGTTTTYEDDLITVPYYDSSKEYDGYLYFQTAGGWGSDGSDDMTTYNETFNYLKVVSTISDLLNVTRNDASNGDIYYVVNIDDIIDYYPDITDLSVVKHTFYVTNEYNLADTSFTGWENTAFATDENIKKKADYLENVISINIGNNPHVGYGKYDNGKSYYEYMAQPFKWAIDTNKLAQEYVEQAEDNSFDVTNAIIDSDRKVKIVSKDELKQNYYLNSKVIRMRNINHSSRLYKQYFNDVILNYVMQVIPSTAILILENFD